MWLIIGQPKHDLSTKNEQLVNDCLMAGKSYDSEGNRRKWWSNSTLFNFHRNSRCLEDQYSNFTFYGNKVVESKLINFLSSSISVFILLLEIDCCIFIGEWTEDTIGEYSRQWRCQGCTEGPFWGFVSVLQAIEQWDVLGYLRIFFFRQRNRAFKVMFCRSISLQYVYNFENLIYYIAGNIQMA